MYKNVIKRFIDIVVSLCLIAVFSPIMLIIAVTIFIDDGMPIIFRQKRVGKNGRDFTIYKFRTMKRLSPREIPTADLRNPYSYMIRTGKFLRATSLDELPQLFNVLKGDMSLIGPRPLIRKEQRMFLLRDRNDIYSVRPGLTGWAQVNGRDCISMEKKISLDKEYVKNCSLYMDLKIATKTVGVVVLRKGYKEGRSRSEAKKHGSSRTVKMKNSSAKRMLG